MYHLLNQSFYKVYLNQMPSTHHIHKMIDLINDTLVSVRFSVNQNVHFEVLLVKMAELIKEGDAPVANPDMHSANAHQAPSAPQPSRTK